MKIRKIYPSIRDGFFMPLDIQLFAASCSISCSQIGISTANNNTTERFTFKVWRTSGSTYWGSAKTVNFTIDGKPYTSTLALPSSQTEASCYVDVVVPHNSDGTKTINFSASIATGTGAGTLTASGSKELIKINRYAAISNFSVAKRNETSVTFSYSTDVECDLIQYSKDNGSTWATLPSNKIVAGLSPNTTYNFKLRVRRKDSQLSTTSEAVQQTTYKVPTHALNNKTENRIVINWSCDSTVDHVWYSKDNGSTWVDAGAVNGTSGTYTISGLNPNTGYNIKTRVRRKASQTTYDVGPLNITTYQIPQYDVKSKTETSIIFSYSADSDIDYVWFSKDNGSTWTGVDVADGKTGTYTIPGLAANTKYQTKVRFRRKATQTTYERGPWEITTYDYPYCTDSPDFTIGNKLTLKFYNPLKREIIVKLIGADGTKNDGDKTTGTTLEGYYNEYWCNRLYATIPNANSGTYKVEVTYGSSTRTRDNKNKYSINTSKVLPTFNNFTYRDSNSVVSNVTGNNQIIVQNVSKVEVTISSANKMVAQKSATAKNYLITMDNLSKSVNYSANDIVTEIGSLATNGTKRLSVRAYDSRSNSSVINKDIVVYPYSNPVINASVTRKNNFEAETTIKVNGSYSRLTINNVDKNTITKVQYRYRETGGTWSSWTQLTTTVSSGKYSCSDVLLNLDNTKSFEFEFQTIDKIKTIPLTKKVDVGEGIFAILSDEKCCTINGQKIIMYDVVDTW